MAPHWIERLKSGLMESLSELLVDAPSDLKLSFEGKVLNQLGRAVAERYRLQKTLDQLPDLATEFTRDAERAIDAGDDNQAKTILHRKAEAMQARGKIEAGLADLTREISTLEALLGMIQVDDASPEDVLARLEKLSDSRSNDDKAQY